MKLPGISKRMTPTFGFSILTHAVREGLSTRRFGKSEVEAVITFFGPRPPECVFCGSADIRRWDHLIPVGLGGDTVLGNMVLACSRCDHSKGRRPFDEWMRSDAPFSPASRGVPDLERRIARLNAYMVHFGYSPRQHQERLTPDELSRFAVIRTKRRELRREINELIRLYQGRCAADAGSLRGGRVPPIKRMQPTSRARRRVPR